MLQAGTRREDSQPEASCVAFSALPTVHKRSRSEEFLMQVVAAQQALAARGDAEAAHTALAVAAVRHEYDIKLTAAMHAMQDSHQERCQVLEHRWQQTVQVRVAASAPGTYGHKSS